VPVVNYEWVLTPGPLEDHETALFVEIDRAVKSAGVSVSVEGTIPIAVSVDGYSDIVNLGARLHEAVTACAKLRGDALGGSFSG
jgi:hypothetical protein